ncbi:aspartic peptidase domain-containing protein [Mycena alexandri]|uniref:Aspartic peptidase domain-containing protein n=1 Tax=Mycena alexandri TaxID=1745969 RepID=A0AAD6STV3_9AGAR|nr:aspartic peptidase domain-containing protein [Mycena alexandri]
MRQTSMWCRMSMRALGNQDRILISVRHPSPRAKTIILVNAPQSDHVTFRSPPFTRCSVLHRLSGAHPPPHIPVASWISYRGGSEAICSKPPQCHSTYWRRPDAFYYLTLSIGTPPQQFRFEVDLDSPYSWVANHSCGLGCDSIEVLYEPSSSSTVTQISTGNSIHYGSATVSGNFVTDAVRLSPYTVPSQFFLLANKLSDNVVPYMSSGILGLAYQNTTQGPSFPMSLSLDYKGQLASAEMSFWVNRMEQFEVDPIGGAFTYGGTNSSFYQGEIEFLPTTAPSNASSWNLNVKEIIMQGTSVQLTPGASALSAFSLKASNISGPAPDVAAIWAAVPDAVPSVTHPGYYQFRVSPSNPTRVVFITEGPKACSTTVNVSISFGGRLWPMNPVDMNIGPSEIGGSQCLGAIYSSSNATHTNGTANWIFGTAFMKNVYSVFQPTPFSIGFAQLATQSSNSNNSHSKRNLIVGCAVGGGILFLLIAVCGKKGGKTVVAAPARWVPAMVRL